MFGGKRRTATRWGLRLGGFTFDLLCSFRGEARTSAEPLGKYQLLNRAEMRCVVIVSLAYRGAEKSASGDGTGYCCPG